MAILHKVLAVYLFVVGFCAWGLLIVTPLYHDGSPDYPHWKILNYFMAAAVLVMLVKGFLMRRDRDAQEGGGTNPIEHLRVSMAFYGTIVLSTLFYWEWFWTLNPESETGEAVTSHLVYFPIVDSLFVVLCLLIGFRFWKEGKA